MTSACLQGWRPPESRISQLIKNMKTSFVSSKFDTVNRAREIERNRSGDLNWNQFFLHLRLAAGKVSSLSNLWASFELIDINKSNMQSPWGHGSPARRLNSPRPRSYGPGGRRRSLSARWPSHWRDIWLLFTLYNNPKHLDYYNSWNFKRSNRVLCVFNWSKLPLWWVFTFM